MHPILFRLPIPKLGVIPIYSYGVMLGLSLVVGWYLTLGLAERDKLPKELMADCYVDTAIAAIIGSRVLYIVTNLSEFDSLGSLFAMRRGGLVAYGGFLGGFVGSYIYLKYGIGVATSLRKLIGRARGEKAAPWQPLPLLNWADVAVPSLASGLLITRIGCYLFGCDFGRPLAESAPEWLKKLGTFPHWPDGTLDHGAGSPAWVQHVKERGLAATSEHSLPVHPTQIYESLVGLGLLMLLLSARRHQKFRGQIFLIFTFAYGVCRFLLEILRDDAERGSLPPSLPEHLLIPLGLAVFGLAFAIGFAKQIKNPSLQRAAQALAFVPALAVYLKMRPESFASTEALEYSTSQFVALSTALGAGIFYSILLRGAAAHPEGAMAVPVLATPSAAPIEDDDEDDDEEDEEDEAPKPPPKKAKKPLKKAAAEKPKRARAEAKEEPDEAPSDEPIEES